MNILNKLSFNLKYLLAKPKYKKLKLDIKIKSIDETLDFMKIPGHSIVRFGDGEMMILDGMSITNHQEYSKQLSVGTACHQLYRFRKLVGVYARASMQIGSVC